MDDILEIRAYELQYKIDNTWAGRNPINKLNYERIPMIFSYIGPLLSQISIIQEIWI